MFYLNEFQMPRLNYHPNYHPNYNYLPQPQHQHQHQHQLQLQPQPQQQTSSPTTSRRSNRAKSKRVRTIFTPEQLKRLEQEFSNQMYLVGHDRVFLAESLNLTEAQVKVWFQNRRIKFRKLNLGSSSIPKHEDEDEDEDDERGSNNSSGMFHNHQHQQQHQEGNLNTIDIRADINRQ